MIAVRYEHIRERERKEKRNKGERTDRFGEVEERAHRRVVKKTTKQRKKVSVYSALAPAPAPAPVAYHGAVWRAAVIGLQEHPRLSRYAKPVLKATHPQAMTRAWQLLAVLTFTVSTGLSGYFFFICLVWKFAFLLSIPMTRAMSCTIM